MSRSKQRSAFDEISEFDRGRKVAYRDCGLSFIEIGSRVGRNQKTVMRLCKRWLQEGTTDRRVRSHPPQCTTSREGRQIVLSARTIRRRLQQSGLSARRPLLCLTLTHSHRHLRHQCTNCRFFETASSTSPRCWSQLSFLTFRAWSQPYFNRIMRYHTWHALSKGFFVNHQIELLPWPARSPDLSPIENMWSMVAQRLTQITPPAATPDQLWQRVKATWSAVPQEHIQSAFEAMPRHVAAVISNNGGYSGY
ncbi:transposable element Tcb1 transposase [Trichonephila clavipes]|nr:transposable element Tcb1 transposase [Trichonephila clavipes]